MNKSGVLSKEGRLIFDTHSYDGVEGQSTYTFVEKDHKNAANYAAEHYGLKRDVPIPFQVGFRLLQTRGQPTSLFETKPFFLWHKSVLDLRQFSAKRATVVFPDYRTAFLTNVYHPKSHNSANRASFCGSGSLCGCAVS